MKTLSITDIRVLHQRNGGKFFDPETKKFFGSRIPSSAYLNESNNTAYFVTSEQQPAYANIVYPRLYTVRSCDMNTGRITTEGEFQAYRRKSAATKQAQHLAAIEVNTMEDINIEATPGTFREWLLDTLVDDDEPENKYHSIIDLANHGADGGFTGLIYTSECVELYNQFESEIWECLANDAEELGYDNPIAMIATFQRNDMLDNPNTFKNLLTWYMAERVAREIVDELEQSED